MAGEKMFTYEEAMGLFDVSKRYLQDGEGDLSAAERKGLGRVLSEIQFTLEVESEPDDTRPPGIRLVR